jgi:hypothetical protein
MVFPETPSQLVRKEYMMRRMPWDESMRAVKLSAKFTDFGQFRKELERSLHYNSSYVRKRNSRSIIRWFFHSHSLDNLLTKVWTFYKNDTILKEMMRYEYLSKEPVVAEFVVRYLLPLDPGVSIEADYLKDFLLKKYSVVKRNPLGSLRTACKDLGFVYSQKKKMTISQIPMPKTSLLILTHYLLAPTPRTVTIRDVLSNPFWQYLGVRESEAVRKVFREADANGAIAKYIVADQLEQITTRYSFDEFVQRKVQI